MNINALGSYAMPILIVLIIISGIIKCKGNIFSYFTSGVKIGMRTVINIAPSLIGLITAVQMLSASGFIDLLSVTVRPFTTALHIPSEIMPLILLRPVSGSGSIALLESILKNYGPDSLAGRTASVICASGETTFYSTTLYFGNSAAKNIRHTLIAALIADFTGIVVSCILVGIVYS